MTRINAPIPVEELCDIHLLAEIRELPRVFNYCAAWDGVTIRQETPKLGKGHVLFWSRFGWYLQQRLLWLVHEAHVRGFYIRHGYTDISVEYGLDVQRMSRAKPILPPAYEDEMRQRICEALGRMKREPEWTLRTMPDWCTDVVVKRNPKDHRGN